MIRYNIDQFLQRPRLHQWMSGGKIHRVQTICYTDSHIIITYSQEAGEQQSSRFELFFDLLFVGMVHQITEATAEQPTGIGFAKYVLTFVPAFSVWADVRDVANQYANDDVTQRAYILWIMILLVGYSNNASAIEFGKTETGPEGALEGAILTEEGLTSMRWTLGFFVVAKLSRGQLPEHCHLSWKTNGAAVVLSLVYALFLPLSRKPLFVSTLNAIVMAILFFIGIFTSLHVTISLVAVGIVLDYLLRVIGVLLFKTMEILGKKYEKRRQQHYRQNSCPWTPADELKTPGMEKSGTDEGRPFAADPTRTVNSSVTAVNEEVAPFGAIKACQRTAAQQEYRFPGSTKIRHFLSTINKLYSDQY
jgi:hypothetical protein